MVSDLLAAWGWLWWVGAGLTAIDVFMPANVFPHASLVFVAFTSLLLPIIAKKLVWPLLARLAFLLLPMMAFALIIDVFESHPLSHYGLFS